ncbi:MAG: hypothetical protein QNL87_04930 [Gammaproteobacteria bacterium]|nr:hypothetical protein [Gammaproteobacteria bacterium]
MTLSILRQSLICILVLLLLAMSGISGADQDVEKTIFLVNESDRIVAVNAETGQFFDLVLSAKERIYDRIVANGVAILVTNQRFAGVSNYPSGWGSVRRKAGEKIVSAEAADHSALVVTSDRILVFNGKTGAWSERRR